MGHYAGTVKTRSTLGPAARRSRFPKALRRKAEIIHTSAVNPFSPLLALLIAFGSPSSPVGDVCNYGGKHADEYRLEGILSPQNAVGFRIIPPDHIEWKPLMMTPNASHWQT